MRRTPSFRLLGFLALFLAAACSPPASDAPSSDPSEDTEALRTLLDDFLANADAQSAHERFWADDVVYTSSTGARRGKAEIMAGFQGPETPEPEEAGPSYAGDQVDIRVYGDAAVVAFRLVIMPPEASGEPVSYNYNTGTFLKRDGLWKAVSWQSTRIPE